MSKQKNLFREAQVAKAVSGLDGEKKDFFKEKLLEYGRASHAFFTYQRRFFKKYPGAISYNDRYAKREAEMDSARTELLSELRKLSEEQRGRLVQGAQAVVDEKKGFMEKVLGAGRAAERLFSELAKLVDEALRNGGPAAKQAPPQ